MRNCLILFAAAMLLAACSKSVMDDEEITQVRNIQFAVGGDFQNPVFTRAAPTADGKVMTDLWLFDYVDGALVQSIHQTADDSDFGAPSVPLAYGEHVIYFVCSRGVGATVSTADHTIVWQNPRDTFWKRVSLSVGSGTPATRIVTLDRVVTCLQVKVNDEVPEAIASITVTPAEWFFGMDYQTAAAMGEQQGEPRLLSIPSSYVGTSGQVSISIYGFSAAAEWRTDFDVVAHDADDNIIGQAAVTNAPFLRNRVTTYSGSLFSSNNTFTITLNDQWLDPFEAEW